MALLSAHDLRIAFGGPPLLDGVSFQLQPGERVGLLGRNGAGKTTLLRILGGEQAPDAGRVQLASGARAAWLPQDLPEGLAGTAAEVVRAGAPASLPAWEAEVEADKVLSRMGLDGSAEFSTLSAGMARRVLLARALVAGPDLLLLDEPTNHLDIEAIAWLEDFLLRWGGTLLFVTHDRAFLRRLATRILEVDRGQLLDMECSYGEFLRRKESLLAAEEQQQALFDKRLAQEEAWIRQGIKARRTRNEGRVRALQEMRRERAARRGGPGQVKLDIESASRSGKLVAELHEVSFTHPGRPIVEGFSTRILRGDKVGILGPNGAGKSTLLKLILGQLQPQSGRVRLGTNLQVAYFDQRREQLDPEKTVQENIAGAYESVKGGRHILSYLQDFLFSPDRARTPVRSLSGGERVRVLLARLFCTPANVIVLDEPTNDLDTETLELLEARLVDFDGTVLLVSHDREFLDNVVGWSLVFEEGRLKEYVGGYSDWLRQRKEDAAPVAARAAGAAKPTPPAKQAKQKLGFNETRELAALPGRIEELEAEREALTEAMAQPGFYQRDGEAVATDVARMEELGAELERAYARWQELEELAS